MSFFFVFVGCVCVCVCVCVWKTFSKPAPQVYPFLGASLSRSAGSSVSNREEAVWVVKAIAEALEKGLIL